MGSRQAAAEPAEVLARADVSFSGSKFTNTNPSHDLALHGHEAVVTLVEVEELGLLLHERQRAPWRS